MARMVNVDRRSCRACARSVARCGAATVRALDPAVPKRIWLVTSALHMPRALSAFRAAGFEPCAYPADVRAARLDSIADVLPSAGAIADTDAVLHEWVGEIVYRIRAF